jgi:hypothetical protein
VLNAALGWLSDALGWLADALGWLADALGWLADALGWLASRPMHPQQVLHKKRRAIAAIKVRGSLDAHVSSVVGWSRQHHHEPRQHCHAMTTSVLPCDDHISSAMR